MSTSREGKGKGKGNVQDGNITEEDADEQRTERGGDRRRVYLPRRWLLEYTGPTRARREQISVCKIKYNAFEFARSLP